MIRQVNEQNKPNPPVGKQTNDPTAFTQLARKIDQMKGAALTNNQAPRPLQGRVSRGSTLGSSDKASSILGKVLRREKK